MLDLETLSTRPNAVILSIGAVKFDPYTDQIDIDEALEMKIDIDEQTAIGRHVQDETIDWWARQTKDIRDEVFDPTGRLSLEDFTKNLNKFLVGVDDIWCQGPVFDIVILEDLYRQLTKPAPWNYWQIRDSRTLFKVHGDSRKKGRDGAHNALIDCIYQAIGVQEIYAKCNKKPAFS